MPRKMIPWVNGLLHNIIIIVIFIVLILSAFVCLLDEKTSIYNESGINNTKVDFFENNEEKNILVPRDTRSGDEDYLDLVWEAGHGTEIGEENSIVSADVDNDGINEVIFGNNEGYIHIIQYSDGEYEDEWKSLYLGSSTQALTTGDVDNDGIIEIVVGTGSGNYFIFGYQPGNGSYMQEWTDYLFAWDVLGLATGDVDNDGFMEIIAGTSSFAEIPVPNVHVFGYDGSSYELEWVHWAEDSYYNNARTIAIGDVDNDGSLEFVVGISEFKYTTETPRGSFYVFGYNNGIYTLEWKRDDNSVDVVDIDIGDVDSDGFEEIVVGSGTVNIYGYESGIYHIENVIPESFSYVEVGNVNEDDIIEIVVGSGSYLSVYQETTEIWEIEALIFQSITGVEINDTDDNLINEIIISFGEFFENTGIKIFEFDGSSFEMDWESQYISSVTSICVDDVDNDLKNELILGMDLGRILLYGYDNGEYEIENSISLPTGADIQNIFSRDFNNDGFNEIAAIIFDEIYFIKYNNGNYEIIDQIEITDGQINSVDIEDVDNNGLPELVVGTTDGFLYVIGYDGMSYTIKWQYQFYNDELTALGIGDTKNDGTLDIVVGGSDIDIVFVEYTIYILEYDGNNYVVKWSYQPDGSVDAIVIGDSDNDGIKEFAVMIGFFDLYIYGWDGISYNQEWSNSDFMDLSENTISISSIENNGENKLIIGENELYVFQYTTTYEYQWQTETINNEIVCIFIGNPNTHGSNEIVVSIGAYIFMYGKEIWPTASLYTSKRTVSVGEEIIFDGSNSKGMGTLEYLFVFGDGTDSGWITESTTSHSYSSIGTYLASLTIRDENGNQSTNPAEITINVIEPNIPPTAYIDEIAPDSAIEGEEISFSGHGTDDDGTITAYWWESNINGFIESSDSFSTSSLFVGTHTISFRVMDNKDTWSENAIGTIEIEPEVENHIPIAFINSISPDQGFEGDTISFSGQGTDDDGSIISYSWESEIDGELSDQSEFSTSTLSVGSHNISFKVQDNSDAWSEPVERILLIEAIPPNQPPTAEIDYISPNSAIKGETVSFSGQGDDEDGSIVSYSWESNIDGFLSSQRSFSTSTLSLGEHIITFKVKDDDNKWSEPVTMVLDVKEKTQEPNKLLFPLILGIGFLAVIAVIATVLAVSRKKNSSAGMIQVNCPGCGSPFQVVLQERPFSVQCPTCSLKGTIN